MVMDLFIVPHARVAKPWNAMAEAILEPGTLLAAVGRSICGGVAV